MRVARVTEKDPTLPHQIVLKYAQSRAKGGSNTVASGGGSMCVVTCNCREPGYAPMGFVHWGDLDEAWRLYEDPDNHDQRAHPYHAGDRGAQRRVLVRNV